MKSERLMSFSCYGCVATIFTLDAIIPPAVNLPVLYIAYVLLAMATSRVSFSYTLASLGTCCTVLALLFHAGSPLDWPTVLFSRSLTLVVMWTVAYMIVARKEIAAVRQTALIERDQAQKEVEELVRLLPMCAWCKKIRDDAGYWEGIESYFVRHTPAITHGICPGCSDRLENQIKGMTCAHVQTASAPAASPSA